MAARFGEVLNWLFTAAAVLAFLGSTIAALNAGLSDARYVPIAGAVMAAVLYVVGRLIRYVLAGR